MDLFNKHQLIPVEDGYKIVLYVNKNATEFSTDLDVNQKTKLVTMDHAIQIYIKEKIPKGLVVKSVQIMMGTILLTTISIMGNDQDTAAASTSTVSTTNGSTYTVVAGDSLWGIANRFGITVNMLKSANGLTTDLLRIGQTLVIPSASATSETTNPSYSNITYQVVSGDSLWGIAKKFGTTVEAIQKTNQLTTTTLSIGQTLLIPTSATNPNPTPPPGTCTCPNHNLYGEGWR
ncbi:LysM peptidoglycan-binding domain-containing protein [Bacillus sp. T3]|uniref:LysM peptidoglycan-binding domain-containing protein n=1 Tax=Bacillus sp. T3 TaxID=467262 RepID=UPI002980C1AA|nr:LysM peptidoglycan-binding domain-containing protein [Bacillus sp. T3]